MENDILLVNETLQGSHVAFRSLVESYQDYVFSIVYKILKNREEAEEAAQDTFLKAYRALASFEQRSKFATWLYQIAWRTAIDRYRSKQPRHTSVDDDQSLLQLKDESQPSPADRSQARSVKAAVEKALDKMKPEDATLLTLYYMQEQSVKEISDVTGLTESNVKVKLFRLRDSLKTLLTQQLRHEVKDLL